MDCYKSFAVVGAGSLGSIVVSELLQRGAAVKILTRDANKATLQAFKDQGATLAAVDFANNDSVEAALTNVDVVVSTVAGLALMGQVEIARAATAAGVKLFVPAEYGVEPTVGPTIVKKIVHDELKTLRGYHE